MHCVQNAFPVSMTLNLHTKCVQCSQRNAKEKLNDQVDINSATGLIMQEV